MKKLRILTVVLIILFVGSFASAQSFKSGSEPDGFRGIRRGTDISALSGKEGGSGDPVKVKKEMKYRGER